MLRRDRDPVHAARVELTFDVAGQAYAMEHTLIEPFEGFLAQNNSDAQSVRDVEMELRSRLPGDSDFFLWIPSTSFDGLAAAEITKVKRAMIDAVLAAATTAPVEATYRSGNGTWLSVPGWTFEFGFRRFERTVDEPKLRVFRVVDDAETQRLERMKRACAKKQPKLTWWKAAGARSILVLENNDIQLSNQPNIAAALAAAESELGEVADEVHLIGTYIERAWFATRLRIDSIRFPATHGPNEPIAEEVDPTTLVDLSGAEI
jgi:hypothetical protein